MDLQCGLDFEIKNLKKLRNLNFAYNKMSGNVPDFEEWALFTQLESIELQNNRFSGDIPKNWRFLTQLVYFNIANNFFGGEVIILAAA